MLQNKSSWAHKQDGKLINSTQHIVGKAGFRFAILEDDQLTSKGVESGRDEHLASPQAVPEEGEEAGREDDGQAQDGEDRRESGTEVQVGRKGRMILVIHD